MSNLLTFDIRPHADNDAKMITPCIDGISLSEMIAAFENTHRMSDPAGGYGGLIPEFFQYGSLEAYFLGQSQAPYFASHISVLACECGELGCWPLNCAVTVTDTTVTWDRFMQPHRPSRDYSGFGPFTFDLEPYVKALEQLR